MVNGVAYVSSSFNHLNTLGAKSGEPLWTFKTRRKVDSSPVVCGDKVVFGTGDGRLYLLDLETGKELWNYEVGKSIIASPAVAGESRSSAGRSSRCTSAPDDITVSQRHRFSSWRTLPGQS